MNNEEKKVIIHLITEGEKSPASLYPIRYVDESRWVDDDTYYVWVSYLWIGEFIEKLVRIVGGVFDEDGITGIVQEDGIVINLCDICGKKAVEEMFPKEGNEVLG